MKARALLRTSATLLLLALGASAQTTPVIGGSCKLGTSDVQIGGKQTQFFLKCEASADAEEGSGVWVVKSRAAAAPPAENTNAAQRPPSRLSPRPNMNPHICEQDNNAREADACTATATCLQLNQDEPSSYLQCEQTNMRWVKKRCAEGLVFNFEQQTCIVPKRVHTLSLVWRAVRSVSPSSSLSACDSCPLGFTCMNGQCLPLRHSHLCPDGSAPLGTCERGCFAPSHSCTSQGICCPRKGYEPCHMNERCVNGRCDEGRECNTVTLCCVETLKGGRKFAPRPGKDPSRPVIDESSFNLIVEPRISTTETTAASSSEATQTTPSTAAVMTSLIWERPTTSKRMVAVQAALSGSSSNSIMENLIAEEFAKALETKLKDEVSAVDSVLENSSDPKATRFPVDEDLTMQILTTVRTTTSSPSTLPTTELPTTTVDTTTAARTTITQIPPFEPPTTRNPLLELYFAGKKSLKPLKTIKLPSFVTRPLVSMATSAVTMPTTEIAVPTWKQDPVIKETPTTEIVPATVLRDNSITSVFESPSPACERACDSTCSAATHECGEDGCCRRFRCSDGKRSSLRCGHKYQCRAGEECFEGVCCPGDEPTTTFSTPKYTFVTRKYSSIFKQVLNDASGSNSLDNLLDLKPAVKAPAGQQDSSCILDPSFRGASCSLRSPCPSTSQCLLKRCCLLPPQTRCPDGKLPLVFPESCAASDDCPIASTCVKAMCCPLVEEIDETTAPSMALTPAGSFNTIASITSLPSFGQIISYDSRLCLDGRESLSTPAQCVDYSQCPQGYICERNKCCRTPDGYQGWQQSAAVQGFSTDCAQEVVTCAPEEATTTTTVPPPTTVPLLPVETAVDANPYGAAPLDSAVDEVKSTATSVAQESATVEENSYGAPVEQEVNYHKAPPGENGNSYKKFQEALSWTTTQTPASKYKVRCVLAQVCNDSSLCPPGFTCTLGGKCCRLNLRCPDYSIPESLCSDVQICPSSTQTCQAIGRGLDACCSPGIDSCPPGSKEVPSRFGGRCRYSLHCPSPYYCSGRGRCCEPPDMHSGQQANGLICTYSSCSNNNPCQTGTCNNGYCCSSNSAPAIIEEKEGTAVSPEADTADSPPDDLPNEDLKEIVQPVEDWPIGPPGYGFPPDLATLDSVLVKASGDGRHCAGGFTSSLKCSLSGECPPGLFCDDSIQLCCPLLLPLTDLSNPTPPEARRLAPGNRMGSYPSPCAGGCPRGYSGCCGTAQASCCLRSQCPSGLQSTGRNCYTSCPDNQLCISGICCAQPTSLGNSCPGGGSSYGNCNYGQCSSGYSCVQSTNQCCPSTSSAPSILLSQCPGGGSASGSCFNGGCSSGYQCSQNNLCCPIINPFLCQDGTQAAGGCVSGQCGAGYSCVNGLCCVSSSNTPKCLDGSEAVGACIPSCVAGQCGNQNVQYFCGTGYTCTAGNICCPTNFGCQNGGTSIGPPVNGLCPTGYELSNNQCCSSATCSNGGTSAGPAINGLCPTGYVLLNGLCCTSTTAGTTCDSSVSIGPCFNGACPTLGYTCDANGVLCCPLVDYTNPSNIIGRAVDGDCPDGYTPVPINGVLQCVSLQSIPGICAESAQAGPCVGNQCPAGYTCFTAAAVCCPTSLRVHRAPTDDMYPGRPISFLAASVYHAQLEEQHKQLQHQIPMCPNGGHAVSACMNGLCGVGFTCMGELCCVASGAGGPSTGPVGTSIGDKPLGVGVCPNGQPAVSSCFNFKHCGEGYVCEERLNLCCRRAKSAPASTTPQPNLPFGNGIQTGTRPIGVACAFAEQCVGFAEGLSTCDIGRCRCTPIAYTQGIACVRRSMKMHDATKEEEESTTAVTPVASTSPATQTTTSA